MFRKKPYPLRFHSANFADLLYSTRNMVTRLAILNDFRTCYFSNGRKLITQSAALLFNFCQLLKFILDNANYSSQIYSLANKFKPTHSEFWIIAIFEMRAEIDIKIFRVKDRYGCKLHFPGRDQINHIHVCTSVCIQVTDMPRPRFELLHIDIS